MSEQEFIQYRDRICDIWVDAQASVLALQAGHRRDARNATIMKWATFVTGTLTGAAGADFLSSSFQLFGANPEFAISGLAFLTAILTGATPLLGYDTKMEQYHKLMQTFEGYKSELRDRIYVMATAKIDQQDGAAISQLSDQVDSVNGVEKAAQTIHLTAAREHMKQSAFSGVNWLGPVAADEGPTDQGAADSLQPLARG